MADQRERRLAKNETFFRETNELLGETATANGQEHADFVCECSILGCVDRVPVTLVEYERIRLSGDRFIVKPGHEEPSIEQVVEERSGYLVVEKIGIAGIVALDSDPR